MSLCHSKRLAVGSEPGSHAESLAGDRRVINEAFSIRLVVCR